MINFFFFFITTLILIVCQTVIFPAFSWFPQSFDILTINVLYLSLSYRHYGVLAGIVLIGGIMDSISGVPFFLHIFSYLWIYFIVRVFRQFVFQRSVMFIMVVSLISVVIHQGLILFSVFLSHGQTGVMTLDYTLVLRQMVWGILFVPSGVWIIHILRQNYIYFIRQFRRELARKYRG